MRLCCLKVLVALTCFKPSTLSRSSSLEAVTSCRNIKILDACAAGRPPSLPMCKVGNQHLQFSIHVLRVCRRRCGWVVL